jgi:hypothetical protein
MRWAGHVARIGEEKREEKACRLLIGKSKIKRPLGRQKCR